MIELEEETIGPFLFENGYHLELCDLGTVGIKLSLSHPSEDCAGIILDADTAKKLISWLGHTLAVTMPR